MKITDEGLIVTCKTERIHYFEYREGKLFPKSVVFIGKFVGHPDNHMLPFQNWVSMMLKDKIVLRPDDEPDTDQDNRIKTITDLYDPYLYVKSTDLEYITTAFFTILKSLLPEEATIKSLEWHN